MMLRDHESKHESFAQLIDRRLKEMGITQLELEARSGVADHNWSRWRKGALPSRVYVKLAAGALDVPPQRLQEIVDEDRRIAAGTPIDTVPQAREWVEKACQPKPLACTPVQQEG